jgi:hypothetical protein
MPGGGGAGRGRENPFPLGRAAYIARMEQAPLRRLARALRRRWRDVPPLLRLIVAHGALGFALGGLAVAALLWFDHSRLLTLMRADASWPLPVVLLWLLLGGSYAGVQVGLGIMALGERKRRDGGGGRRLAEPLRVPVAGARKAP